MILCVCWNQCHAWKRNKRQALIVMDLHLLKTPATSASWPEPSRDLQLHHKNWQKWRNMHLHCFLELFYSCLLGLSLVASSVYMHWGWGKVGIVKTTTSRHTYFMYGCSQLKVMLLLTTCSLAPGDHTARLVFRLHWKGSWRSKDSSSMRTQKCRLQSRIRTPTVWSCKKEKLKHSTKGNWLIAKTNTTTVSPAWLESFWSSCSPELL